MRLHHVLTVIAALIIGTTACLPTLSQSQPKHPKSVVVLCNFELADIPQRYVSHLHLAYIMSRTASPTNWAGDYNSFPELWTKSALLTINSGNRLSTVAKRIITADDIKRGNARLIYTWRLGVLADSISKSGSSLTTWDIHPKQTASLLALGSNSTHYSLPASTTSHDALEQAITNSKPGLVVFSPRNADRHHWTELLPQLEDALRTKAIDSYVLLRPVGSVSDGDIGVGAGIVAVRYSGANSGLLHSRATKITGYVTLSDITALFCHLAGAKAHDPTYTGLVPQPVSTPYSIQKLGRLHGNMSGQHEWERLIGNLPSLQFAMLLCAIICSALGFHTAKRLLSIWPYSIPLLGLTVGSACIMGHWPIWVGALIWVVLTVLMIAWSMRCSSLSFSTQCSIFVITLITVALAIWPDLMRWTGFGYSPQEGSRYYGIGNELEGLTTGAVAIIAYRYPKIAVAMMVIWIGISGMPSLGADVGAVLGTAAMMAAYIFLHQWSKGHKRLAIGGVSMMCILVVLIAAFSYFIAPDSHIGEFLHDPSSWAMTFTRKWAMNMKLLQYSPWSLLMWISLALMLGLPIWMWAGVLALFFLNDSGVIAAATMASWLGVWHLNDQTVKGPISRWGDLGIRLRDALAQQVDFQGHAHRKSQSDNVRLKED